MGEAEKASERPDLSWTLIVRHLDGVEKSGDGLGLVAEMHHLSGKQGDGELGRSLRKPG